MAVLVWFGILVGCFGEVWHGKGLIALVSVFFVRMWNRWNITYSVVEVSGWRLGFSVCLACFVSLHCVVLLGWLCFALSCFLNVYYTCYPTCVLRFWSWRWFCRMFSFVWRPTNVHRCAAGIWRACLIITFCFLFRVFWVFPLFSCLWFSGCSSMSFFFRGLGGDLIGVLKGFCRRLGSTCSMLWMVL